MKRLSLLVALALAFVTGCTTAQPQQAPPPAAVVPPPVERPVWASEAERPKWTVEDPAVEGTTIFFVGAAERYATEPEARDQAMRNSIKMVVGYLGTQAKDKYEKVATSFGLSSAVVDPTNASREYEKQLSENVVKKAKAKKWYIEQWNYPTGMGYKVFALVSVPVDEVNDAFKQTAKQNMEDAQKAARAASDTQAKSQAENAAKFWEEMTKQGVVE